MEDSSQSREHGVSLLMHRRQIPADAAKSGDPRGTTKDAGNLLLHFGPAQIPLGLVVRQRNAQIVQQPQHLLGPPQQGIQQILGLALLGPAFGGSCGRAAGAVERHSPSPESRNSGRPSRRARWRARRSGGADVICGRRHADQARSPASGWPTPGALAQRLLYNRVPGGLHRCCAQVIGIIAGKVVVHASLGLARPDADLVHGLSAARLMPGQMGQERGAVHIQPRQHPIHANASFISMLQRASSDQISNALDGRSQPLGGQAAPLQQGGFRDVAPTERSERLAGAHRWQPLPLVQIHGQRLQVGTILHGGTDRSRKAAQAGAVTAGATDGFDLMFLGQQTDFRHIQDLTAFYDAAWDRAEVCMALAADLLTVMYDFIWRLHQKELRFG